MVVRLAKRLFFKPRKCPNCGKHLYFCEHPKSVHCRACSKSHDRAYEHYFVFWVHKTIARKYGYCALCGTREKLTIHHVGGGYKHYTTLCEGCHANYETYATILCNELLPLFRSYLWQIRKG